MWLALRKAGEGYGVNGKKDMGRAFQGKRMYVCQGKPKGYSVHYILFRLLIDIHCLRLIDVHCFTLTDVHCL